MGSSVKTSAVKAFDVDAATNAGSLQKVASSGIAPRESGGSSNVTVTDRRWYSLLRKRTLRRTVSDRSTGEPVEGTFEDWQVPRWIYVIILVIAASFTIEVMLPGLARNLIWKMLKGLSELLKVVLIR